jgi:hypothetical protein
MGMTSAEKMRAARARAAAKGKCIVCCTGKRKRGLTVCDECNEAAKERVRASRG